MLGHPGAANVAVRGISLVVVVASCLWGDAGGPREPLGHFRPPGPAHIAPFECALSTAKRARLAAAARRRNSSAILSSRGRGRSGHHACTASGERVCVRPWAGWPGSRRANGRIALAQPRAPWACNDSPRSRTLTRRFDGYSSVWIGGIRVTTRIKATLFVDLRSSHLMQASISLRARTLCGPHRRPPIRHDRLSTVGQERVPPRIGELPIGHAFGSAQGNQSSPDSLSACSPEPTIVIRATATAAVGLHTAPPPQPSGPVPKNQRARGVARGRLRHAS